MIDVFLMSMMMIAFRFNIKIGRFLMVSEQTVDIVVVPELGLFTFITAAALSLCLNHALLVFHRNAEGSDATLARAAAESRSLVSSILQDFEQRTVDEESLAASDHCFACPEGSWFDKGTVETMRPESSKRSRELSTAKISLLEAEARRMGSSAAHAVLGVFPFLLFAIYLSASAETFEFVFGGLAGDLLGVVDPSSVTRKESLLSIARSLLSSTEGSSELAVAYLATMYLLFAFVFPLLQITLLFGLYFARVDLRSLKILFYVCEIAGAWASLDVFIVSIVASVMQIDQFSHFLEGPLCDPIKATLRVDDCFVVGTTILQGSWIMLGTAATCWVFAFAVNRSAELEIVRREDQVLDAL